MLVVLGLACGVALGALVVLILRDRRRELAALPPLAPMPQLAPPMPSMPLSGWMTPSSPSLPAADADSKMGSFTVGADSARTVFQAANGREWLVQVSCVAPSGSFAFFSTDPSLIGVGTALPPNAIAVPAGGQPRDLSLKPGEILYTRGSLSNTVITYTARAI